MPVPMFSVGKVVDIYLDLWNACKTRPLRGNLERLQKQESKQFQETSQ